MQQELLTDDLPAADVSHVTPDVRSRALSHAEPSPLMLLEKAVDQGMEPAQLKALVDLHEQWRAARAKEAFFRDLNACQAEMPVIVRDGENTHTRSRYAKLDGIVHSAKPIYTRNGFALCFSEADSAHEGFKRIVCDISHREGHCERRWLDLPIDGTGAKGGKSSMNEVQGCISTGSYGQRVLICRIFNITIADTDLDGNVPPPMHDNPQSNRSAPNASPRGQRQEPHPLAVNAKQMKHLTSQWQAKNPDPDGDLNRQRSKFSEWARATTKRSNVFDPSKLQQWALEDYQMCCDALGCPTLEDLESMQ